MPLKGPSHLATVTQIFDVVTMSSEMGCIVINITVRTWRQKKTYRCRQVRTGPKAHVHQARVEAKAKSIFDVGHLFFNLYLLSFCVNIPLHQTLLRPQSLAHKSIVYNCYFSPEHTFTTMPISWTHFSTAAVTSTSPWSPLLSWPAGRGLTSWHRESTMSGRYVCESKYAETKNKQHGGQ